MVFRKEILDLALWSFETFQLRMQKMIARLMAQSQIRALDPVKQHFQTVLQLQEYSGDWGLCRIRLVDWG
jgi:hypothetical protein